MKQHRCDICGKTPSDQIFRRVVTKDAKVLWICLDCWQKKHLKKGGE